MSKSLVTLGPFAGGLNTLGDQASIDDTELYDVVNFEFDVDGSLTSRFPITKLNPPTGLSGTNFKIIGFFLSADQTRYTIGSTETGTYYSIDLVTWTSITTSFGASDGVQYAGFFWILAPTGSTGSSGKWNPTTAFAAVTNMPKGDSIVVHKNRMWVVPGKLAATNGSRLTFSDISGTDGSTTWNATGFIDVNPGSDGQNLVDLIIDGMNIVLFKQDSTYLYSYAGAGGPAAGAVTLLSGFIGISDVRCVVNSDQGLFVYHKGSIYNLVSNNYEKVNQKVPFQYTPGTYSDYNTFASLSYFDQRLIVRHYDQIYVFYLKTGTWSRWQTTYFPAWFLPTPRVVLTTQAQTAYGASLKQGVIEIYQIQNQYTSTNKEQMTCSIKTKIYDYKSPSTYKRLFWWAADIIAKGAVSVQAIPVIYRSGTFTWDDLEKTTWDNFGSWDYLLYSNPAVVDNAAPGDFPSRKFVKFIKSLRFRQVYFSLTVDTDGSVSANTNNGIFAQEPYPCKLFSFTTVVANKELVPAKVS